MPHVRERQPGDPEERRTDTMAPDDADSTVDLSEPLPDDAPPHEPPPGSAPPLDANPSNPDGPR